MYRMFPKKLVGRKDKEDASRFKEVVLTQEEARMVFALTLKFTRVVD